ncbi:MAG: protein-L-isoaspartate(D-aspartate) O-methyltransferase [Gammaproteobacteria bacterium]|nr:protein-L-isoaspartate(D-aspartate) O-methyltransferase [Gammaproteobacteria bacterium]
MGGRFVTLAVALLLLVPTAGAATMQQMLEAIRDDTRRTAGYTRVSHINPAVLKAMATVPREEFVPDGARAVAYVNRPLPIGHGQTISQPFIVALMTHLLEPTAESRVLEIGTGSGYQAAVLATVVDTVHTIEIIPELAEDAAARLKRLGYDNVEVKAGDGWYGWPEAAPFDAIMVTAVGEDVPDKLVQQLRPGGRLVLPIGDDFDQNLAVVEKAEDGEITMRHVLPVRFVPLTGDH